MADEKEEKTEKKAHDKKQKKESFYDAPWDVPFTVAYGIQRALYEAVDEVNRVTRGGSSPSPGSEVIEEDDAVYVYIDLPGVKEKDIEVTLEEKRLVVNGERHRPEGVSSEAKKSSSYYGPFTKRLPLPCEVDGESVDASLRDGVLSIVLPKKEAPKIKIKVKQG